MTLLVPGLAESHRVEGGLAVPTRFVPSFVPTGKPDHLRATAMPFAVTFGAAVSYRSSSQLFAVAVSH